MQDGLTNCFDATFVPAQLLKLLTALRNAKLRDINNLNGIMLMPPIEAFSALY